MAHNIKPGVATGDQVQEIFNYAKEKGFNSLKFKFTNLSGDVVEGKPFRLYFKETP